MDKGVVRGGGLPIFRLKGFVLSLFLTVSWDLRLAWHTKQCPCFSVTLEATHKANLGSETDTGEILGGTEYKIVSPTRGH